MTPKRKTIIASCVAVFIAVATPLLIAGLNIYSDKKRPNFSGECEVFIHPGDTPDMVFEGLDSLIIRPRSVKRVLGKEAWEFQPGHYTVRPEMTTTYACRMFSHGWQTPVKLVLSGTLRLKGPISRKIANQLLIDSATVHNALNDTTLLAGYGFTPDNVFSMIIPDTYEVWWTDSIKAILDKQKEAYDAFWTPENLAKAEARGLTPMEVSILASIVKGESNYQPEFPNIAGVYLNRLNAGMRLQADPTVAYCFGYTLNRIYRKHTEVDSPYNTYKHAGLPPGPICVPTKPCLEAVLNPAVNNYMYFCADPSFNGSHRFAATYSEHLRNAAAFQKALNERNKAQK